MTWGSNVDWDDHAPASAAGATGWVLQNDILQALAPTLSARSDTFRIRGYGAALNPEDNEPGMEAWCEVVVQRVPDWVDADDLPEVASGSPINLDFGRRFVVVDFRWLSEPEI